MTTVARLAPFRPLTTMEELVVSLLAEGHSGKAICGRLKIQHSTYCYYLREIAAKLPGDLPRATRIIVWWRGADLRVLTGATE